MKITQHFKLEEFEKSETAKRLGIDNSIPAALISNIKALCENVLQPLRDYVGVPIKISSGYRCPQLNAAVGGAKSSQHMKGEAADIHIPSVEVGRKWFEILKTLPHDQLIWERNSPTSNHYWIHVSCRADLSKNRGQCIPLLNKYSA